MTAPGLPERLLEPKRDETRVGIGIGYAGGAALYAAAFALVPALAGMATFDDRLRLALWLCAVPALFVYAVFFACLRLIDTHDAVNPLIGAESPRWKINQRVLTNSVEQTAIFVPLLLALAARVDADHARLLPLHAAMWLFGRVAFWIGYRIHPAWRAPGMAVTHVATLATIGWLVRFSVA